MCTCVSCARTIQHMAETDRYYNISTLVVKRVNVKIFGRNFLSLI